jgi:hypothetical protein
MSKTVPVKHRRRSKAVPIQKAEGPAISVELRAKLEALGKARAEAARIDVDRLAAVGFLAAKTDTALRSLIPVLRALIHPSAAIGLSLTHTVDVACLSITAAGEEFDRSLRGISAVLRRVRELEDEVAEALGAARAETKALGGGIQ